MNASACTEAKARPVNVSGLAVRVAVAAADSTIVVLLVMLEMVVPPGMFVPVTDCPTYMVAVLDNPEIVVLALVWFPVKMETSRPCP